MGMGGHAIDGEVVNGGVELCKARGSRRCSSDFGKLARQMR